MAQVNIPQPRPLTHEGAPARIITDEQELRRSVLACLLWEDTFYESGLDIADRIKDLCTKVDPRTIAFLAVEARNKQHLRHVPLLLTRELARRKDGAPYVAPTLYEVIRRADELGEFIALYWRKGKQPLSAQVKKGLARAIHKFDAYQLAKYANKPAAIKLKDVLALVHPKPKDEEEELLWEKVITSNLPAPDTWEVALSAGADKKATFERLLKEGKLGYLALLRNLRNMAESGVDLELARHALLAGARRSKALPFRFISAARHCMELEPTLDAAMQLALEERERLPGRTMLLVDVSGSMTGRLSGRSEITRMDAGAALCSLVAGIAESYRVFTFSDSLVEVPPRKGMALIDAVIDSQPHGWTNMGGAVEAMNRIHGKQPFDRLIVFTDEQTHNRVPNPGSYRGYTNNVATYRNGVGYAPWIHVDGFSEAVIDWIIAYEKEFAG